MNGLDRRVGPALRKVADNTEAVVEMSCLSQNVFETWRLLDQVRRYDPRNKTKGLARLSKVLNPSFPSDSSKGARCFVCIRERGV
eukprot:2179592-Amphidinium_carterae.1